MSRKELMDEVERQNKVDMARVRDAGKIALYTKLTLIDNTGSWILEKTNNKWSVQYKGQRNLSNVSLEVDNNNMPIKIFYECISTDTIKTSDEYAALRAGQIPKFKFCKTIEIDPPAPAPRPVEPQPKPQEEVVYCSHCGAMNYKQMKDCRLCGLSLLGEVPKEEPKKRGLFK